MGNAVSVDSRPQDLVDVIRILASESSAGHSRETDIATVLSEFYSNIKIWSIHENTPATPFCLVASNAFDERASYLVVHLYRDSTKILSPTCNSDNRNVRRKTENKDHPAGGRSLLTFALQFAGSITPRGSEYAFSSSNEPFNSRSITHISSNDDLTLNYDLYVWNGNGSSAMTRATAIAKGYELERNILNAKPSALRILFASGKPVSLSEYFKDDALASNAIRHLSSHDANEEGGNHMTKTAQYAELCQQIHLFRTLVKNKTSQHSEQDSGNYYNRADRNEIKPPQSPPLSFLLGMPTVSADFSNHQDSQQQQASQNGLQHQSPRTASPLGSPEHSDIDEDEDEDEGDSKDHAEGFYRNNNNNINSGITRIGLAIPELNLRIPSAASVDSGNNNSGISATTKPAPFSLKIKMEKDDGEDSQHQPANPLVSRMRFVPSPPPTSPPARDQVSPGARALVRAQLSLGGATQGKRPIVSQDKRPVIDLSMLPKDTPKDEVDLQKRRLVEAQKVCSKVDDYLFLGGDAIARNKQVLMENGIKRIINAAGMVCKSYFPDDFEYKTLYVLDSAAEDISPLFLSVIDYIEQSRASGSNVYVHCHQGVSRSACLVIAYLMWRDGKSFEETLAFVKSKRGACSPNTGFIVQLLAWDKTLRGEPRGASHLYRIAPFSQAYPMQIVPKKCDIPNASANGSGSVLDCRTCFVLTAQPRKRIFIWRGAQCNDRLFEAGTQFAEQVAKYLFYRPRGVLNYADDDNDTTTNNNTEATTITVEEQGSESDEFWLELESATGQQQQRGFSVGENDTYSDLAFINAPPQSSDGNEGGTSRFYHHLLDSDGGDEDNNRSEPDGEEEEVTTEGDSDNKNNNNNDNNGAGKKKKKKKKSSSLYSYPEWEHFDSQLDEDDLWDNKAYVLQPGGYDDDSSVRRIYVWVGCDVDLEDAAEDTVEEFAIRVGREFIEHMGMDAQTTEVVAVEQGEEPDEFWEWFD